jgi:hypothetical protein
MPNRREHEYDDQNVDEFSDPEYDTDYDDEYEALSDSEISDSGQDIEDVETMMDFEKKIAREKAKAKAEAEEKLIDFPLNVLAWVNAEVFPLQTTAPKQDFPNLNEKFQCEKKSNNNSKSGGFINASEIQVFYGPVNAVLVKEGPYLCPNFQQGKCEKETCPFVHEKPKSGKQPMSGKSSGLKCRYGANCTRDDCLFLHEDKTVPETKNRLLINEPIIKENKKHLLCKDFFSIQDGKIIKKNNCKREKKCFFAHTLTEVKNAIEANSKSHECSYGQKCKGVVSTKQQIIQDNKPITIIKYQNRPEFKCSRLHNKERIKDFLIRVNQLRQFSDKNPKQ